MFYHLAYLTERLNKAVENDQELRFYAGFPRAILGKADFGVFVDEQDGSFLFGVEIGPLPEKADRSSRVLTALVGNALDGTRVKMFPLPATASS